MTRLGAQVEDALAAGAGAPPTDRVEGRFVPNLTFGPLIVAALKPLTKAAGVRLEAHLMVVQPESLIPGFIQAGADLVTVHVETCPHLHRTIQQIKELGALAGVTLNPATPLVSLEEILSDVDLVLIMTVNPGFGGQSYLPSSTARIARVRQNLDKAGLSHIDLEVDGGVKPGNVAEVVAAGANALVVGSTIFNHSASVAENMEAMRKAIAR